MGVQSLTSSRKAIGCASASMFRALSTKTRILAKKGFSTPFADSESSRMWRNSNKYSRNMLRSHKDMCHNSNTHRSRGIFRKAISKGKHHLHLQALTQQQDYHFKV